MGDGVFAATVGIGNGKLLELDFAEVGAGFAVGGLGRCCMAGDAAGVTDWL